MSGMNNVEAGEDMLSSLSDDILITILSLLPLHTAVTTGILSKRWRSLWTHITNLDIDSRYTSACGRYAFPTLELEKHFGKTLSKFTSPFIRRFRLNLLDSFYSFESSWTILDSWFRELCARNIEEIQITSYSFATCFSFTPPPTCIFRIHSLVSLEYDLMSGIEWSLPDHDDAINLPNLKKLSLRVVHSQTGLLENFIRACPSLEDFTLMVMSHSRNDGQSADIILCSESLKSLRIVDYLKYLRRGIKFVIEAPNLDYLRVDSPEWSTVCFVNNPVKLKEAFIYINVFSIPPLGDSTKRFGAMSCIRTLILDRTPMFSEETTFPNLTFLSLTMCSSHDFDSLSLFLALCPILEELILYFSIKDFGKSSVFLTYVAPCLSTKIKRVELKECGLFLEEHLMSLVRRLLRNAMSLERLILDYSVECRHVVQDEEIQLCKKLYKFPAVSFKCQIEFSGRHLKFVGKAGVKPTFSLTP